MLAAVLATVLAVLMVGVQPFAGRRRYRELLARLAEDDGARLRHYRRGIAGEWAGVAAVAAVGILADRSARSIGLVAADASGWWTVLEVVVLLALSTLVMRQPALRQAVRSQAASFLALLPRSSEERWTFAVLALTAGVCEEVLYRGFLWSYVQ